MARYIDADKLNKKKKYSFQIQGMPFPKSEWFVKANDLFSAPTEDVAEVVRCKDCKYSDLYCGLYRCENPATPWYNNEFAIVVEPTDFCSYGERR